jgi:hypothetical protein
MNFNLPPNAAPLMAFIAIATVIITGIVHICFATAVYREATTMLRDGKAWLVPPFVWALATLIGGVFMAGVFWVVHYSRISPSVN